MAVPISGGGSTYIIYVKDNKQRLQSQTLELFTIILEALLFSMIISVVLSFLLSKTMTTPIENITRSAKYIAAGDFTHRPEVQSNDEIGVLAQTFNDMARVLKDTLEAVGSERDKLSTLFLHMTDGVAAFTRDGRLTQLNPAAESMLRADSSAEPSFNEVFRGIADISEISGLRQPSFREIDYTMDRARFEAVFRAVRRRGCGGRRDGCHPRHHRTDAYGKRAP